MSKAVFCCFYALIEFNEMRSGREDGVFKERNTFTGLHIHFM